MSITVDSKVKDILANEEALAIVKQYLPTIDDPRTKAAAGMSLKALLAFPQTKCPKETQTAIADALEAADIDE